MLPNIRTATTAAIAALALVATAAAPVQAGQRERDFLKGVAATVIVGTVIQSMNQRAQAQPRYQQAPRYTQQPQYYVPPTREPAYFAPPAAQTGISTSAASQAFKSYSPTERRAIQRQLARMGYYGGAIDGAFGPATFRAVSAYAADRGLNARIDSASGAYTVYDSLIY